MASKVIHVKMKLVKPFLNSSTAVNDTKDSSGSNKVFSRYAKIGGKAVQLNFVMRSDKDVLASRNTSYRLLVP